MIDSSTDFDIQNMVGLELEQICVGRFQIILRFDGDASISCNTGLSIYGRDVVEMIGIHPLTENVSNLFALLGQKVQSIRFDENENLCVTFEEHNTIEVAKDDQGYESYEIWKGNSFMVA